MARPKIANFSSRQKSPCLACIILAAGRFLILTQPLWTSEPPNRAQWKWRRVKHGFGMKQRKSLVDELQYWNTALKNCFEKLELPAEDDNIKVRELQGRFNPKHCDSVRENVEAIHRALEGSWNCGCPCSHHATINLDWQSGMSTLPSVFDIALSFRDAPTQGTTAGYCWRKLQINVEKTVTTDVISSAPSVQSAQSSAAPSPTSWRSSRKNKLSRLFTQAPNQKSKQVTFAAPVRTGKSIVATGAKTV